MANLYGSLEALKGSLAIDDASDDATLEACLEAASRAVDQIAEREFFATAKTRYYSAGSVEGKALVLGADLLSVTTLTNGDGTALEASSYRLLPRNTPPYRQITLLSDYAWEWDDADSEIVVVGSWGYAASPPANVERAAVLLAARLFKRKDAPLGVLGGSDVAEGVRIARSDPDVRGLLPGKRGWVL